MDKETNILLTPERNNFVRWVYMTFNVTERMKFYNLGIDKSYLDFWTHADTINPENSTLLEQIYSAFTKDILEIAGKSENTTYSLSKYENLRDETTHAALLISAIEYVCYILAIKNHPRRVKS